MKNKQRTLITGLWKHKNSEGEVVLSGKIGVNLTAIIVKNPDTKRGTGCLNTCCILATAGKAMWYVLKSMRKIREGIG